MGFLDDAPITAGDAVDSHGDQTDQGGEAVDSGMRESTESYESRE